MVSGHIFHCRRNSWPAEEYVGRTALQLLDFDGGAPPEQAWRRKLNSHANLLKEFSVTFMEAMRMMSLGLRLWSYVREEASHGRKAPIDPFTKERCRPSASQGVPLGGMGCVPLCLCLCFSELHESMHCGGIRLDISRLFLQER
jgi:non-lysosomal glucosylceramidase